MQTATTRGVSRVTKAPDERRAEIISTARMLFGARGIAKTSIGDVALHIGVARSLIYYYFADKDTLVDEVLHGYIDEFLVSIRRWDAARETGNIDLALTECIRLFRGHQHQVDPLREDLRKVENAALYNRFIDQVVDAIVDCFQITTVEAYAQLHDIEIAHVRDTFVVLVYGLINLTRVDPSIDDAVLISIVRQTLHLPLKPK